MAAKEKTTDQKRAELLKLSSQTQQNLFHMLRLADEILSDHEFVALHGGEAKVLDDFQTTDFAHFGGRPSVSTLLRAYRANPSLATWKEYKFDYRAMIDLANGEKEDGEGKPYTNWKAQCAELQERVKSLESQLAETRELNAKLRSDHEAQLNMIGELRGQLKMLNGGRLVGAA